MVTRQFLNVSTPLVFVYKKYIISVFLRMHLFSDIYTDSNCFSASKYYYLILMRKQNCLRFVIGENIIWLTLSYFDWFKRLGTLHEVNPTFYLISIIKNFCIIKITKIKKSACTDH